MFGFINIVKNIDIPIRIWLGGTCCVPKAFLKKCKDIIILVKDVSITIIEGANVKIVNNTINCTDEATPPSVLPPTLILG